MGESAFPFEVKQLSEDGQFEGWASTYGNPDNANEIIDPGAFSKTLASSKQRPLLWMHRDPIGIVTLADSPAGLLAKGKLTLQVQQAREAHALLQDGAVRGLSIGFQTLEAQYDAAGMRHLKELKLYEVSLVHAPCNPAAQVTVVKDAEEARIRTALQEFKDGIFQACGLKASSRQTKSMGKLRILRPRPQTPRIDPSIRIEKTVDRDKDGNITQIREQHFENPIARVEKVIERDGDGNIARIHEEHFKKY